MGAVSEFLSAYEKQSTLRFHMPGHKGISGYGFDITEINGAGNLYEPDGIIADSERTAAELFNTKATYYSAHGSTLGIQAMLTLMKWEGRGVIAARNVHKAFINSAALLDIDVHWIGLKHESTYFSGGIRADILEKLLADLKKPCCVYITSPDYLGRIEDIAAVCRLCRKYDARVIVDNAHGAHLAFFEENLHPIALGADLCCDSAHKMLPVLTGGAYVHTGRAEYADKIKTALSLFGSTSPSYLILESLDRCNEYIKNYITEDISIRRVHIRLMKKRLSGKYTFLGNDPFHITISGINGVALACQLRANNIEPEYADGFCIVMLASPVTPLDDLIKLESVLHKIQPEPSGSIAFEVPLAERAVSIREATFAAQKEINTDDADGRICGVVKIPCPPCVPVIMPGEIFNADIIKIFKNYGIETVSVI